MIRYTPEPHVIVVNDLHVTVKMMDDGWILDRCVSHSPFIPDDVSKWTSNDKCSRLCISGDAFGKVMRQFYDEYGNAAVIAWDDRYALGHITFLPKVEAIKHSVLHHERMSLNNENVLIVGALGFCSIGGQKYRNKGIGKKMAQMMIEWAKGNGWKKLEVYGVSSGIFPSDWYDACVPPKIFWEKLGFKVTSSYDLGFDWEKVKELVLTDNPRNCETEKQLKHNIINRMNDPKNNREDWAFNFDMELIL